MIKTPLLYAIRSPDGTLTVLPTYAAGENAGQRKSQAEPGKVFVLYRLQPVEAYVEEVAHGE